MSKSTLTSDQIQQQIEIDFPFTKTNEPSFGDVVMFNVSGNPLHIGFVLDDTFMLHTHDLSGVTVESYRGIKWQKRIAGFWTCKMKSKPFES